MIRAEGVEGVLPTALPLRTRTRQGVCTHLLPEVIRVLSDRLRVVGDVLLDGGPNVRLLVPIVHTRRDGVRLNVVVVRHGCSKYARRRERQEMVVDGGQREEEEQA